MENIRIKNLKSLSDSGLIRINDLTVLVGKNSTGKSTFLRVFPLFKQTVMNNVRNVILWYSSELVDFGSYDNALNRNSDYMEFSFQFDLNINRFNARRGKFWGMHNLSDYGVELKFRLKDNIIDKLSIVFNEVNYEIIKNNNCYDLFVNHTKVFKGLESKERANQFFPDFIKTNKISDMSEYFFIGNNYQLVYEEIISHLELETKEEKVRLREIIENINFSMIDKIGVQNIETEGNELINKLINTSLDSDKIEKCKKIFYAGEFNKLMKVINYYFSSYFENVRYIAPIRSMGERFYRVQDLSIDEIDPQGLNIPMILHNMKDDERNQFEEWVMNSFGFSIKSNSDHNHTTINIIIDNNEMNLIDTGFGFSQILPIILMIWREKFQSKRINTLPNTVVIEQPELHLHPALQAKLIDVILRIINEINQKNKKVKFIIETHSETIINRIGENIRREQYSQNIASIYFFEKNSEIKNLNFNEEGVVENWPIDFFYPER